MNTNRTDIHKAFLQLVRIGIGTSKEAKVPHEIDWPAVKDLAERQGLSAVVAHDETGSGVMQYYNR